MHERPTLPVTRRIVSRHASKILGGESSVQNAVTPEQASLARRYGLDPVAADAGLKVGIARNVLQGATPLNGLRHAPDAGTTGWFIWGGEELSDDPDFFVPLHVEHLVDWCPDVVPYLALPPGWRFLIVPGYEDVWFDPDLL